MKALTHILSLLLLLSSCSKLEEESPLNNFSSEEGLPLIEVRSQGFKEIQGYKQIDVIDLDSVSNFSELRKKMGAVTCKGKVSGLRFRSNDTLYYLTGFADCPASPGIGCYFRRNYLYVRNDSLVLDFGKTRKKEPIEYLKTELNEVMSKPYTFHHKEDKLMPALIYFHVEDKYPISTTKRALKEIVHRFEEIHAKNSPDYFKYHILFKGYDITNLPPPPPPGLPAGELEY